MLLAVTGKPIAHSASPELHRAGMKALKIKGFSLRLMADSAQEALTLARDLGVIGLNITAPFKEEFAELVDNSDDAASELGAVNTLLIKGDQLLGYNTDVYGVMESIKPHLGLLKADSKAVILGAGGAAKAVAKALRNLGITFCVISRGPARAEALAREYQTESFLFGDDRHEEVISGAALLINCLSVLDRPFRGDLLCSTQIILDSHYKEESEITKEAHRIGAKVVSGLDWLVHQSRDSQNVFFGKAPSFEDLKQGLTARKRGKSIALIGLMGVGKSMVGKGIASKLGSSFIDLDRRIEQAHSQNISDIFSENGEPYFRKLESDQLHSIEQEEPHILSCGGGIVLDQKNRDHLRNNYRVIWLWADASTICTRLDSEDSRPLLRGGEKLQRLEELLASRKSLYAEVADLVLDTSNRTQQQVIERVYEEIC